MHDFIGVYENAFPHELCNALISEFESLRAANLVLSRQQTESVSKLNKDTQAVFASRLLCDSSTYGDLVKAETYAHANACMWNYLNQYLDKYDTLRPPNSGAMSVYTQKIQRTDIGGGYHDWHYESDTRGNSGRVLLYLVYLNDVAEGGETELLYYHRRIKPKAGTMIVIPSAFTHTHRGNPPLSNTKYIFNGWLEF